MLYFAYGSNMQLDQIRERCPSARFVCAARLKGHRLAFTRLSKNRQCGVADVVQSTGAEVWGTVFQIDETEIGVLDKSEGFRPGRQRTENAYERNEMHVERAGEGRQPLAVWTYTVVTKLDPNPKPSQEYKQLILDGARMWSLPTLYIQQLEAIETQ